MQATQYNIASSLLSFIFLMCTLYNYAVWFETKNDNKKRQKKSILANLFHWKMKKKKSNCNKNVWVLWGFYLRAEEQGEFLTMLESSCNLSKHISASNYWMYTPRQTYTNIYTHLITLSKKISRSPLSI